MAILPMKTRFQELVQEVSLPQKSFNVSTGGLFVGLSTEPDIWGQKKHRFKSDEENENWQPDQPEDNAPPSEEPSVAEESCASAVKVDPTQIATELGLSDEMSVRELQALRRTFARQNHPDKCSEERLISETRMKIANVIIDERIRSKSQS